jgi:uncharacterized membrane-anchored protein YhcB (DUF1043 family)
MDLISVVTFFVGCIVGTVGCLLVVRQVKSDSTIERQMRELQEEFTAYRENVNQHFNQTAKLVNSLTENYIAVQKHLEDAAESFSQPPKSFELDTSNNTALTEAKQKFATLALQTPEPSGNDDASFGELNEAIEQPRDYAPKASPKDKGTLAEDFGLHEKP